MTDPFICRSCRIPLGQVRMEHGIFWACGRALSVELLRRTFTNESINPFWRRAVSNAGAKGRDCPCCGRSMLEVALADSPNSPAVDVLSPLPFRLVRCGRTR